MCTKLVFFFLDNKGDGIWAQDILGAEQINALKFVYPNNKHRYLSVFPSLWFSPGVMFRWGNLSKAAFCHEPKRRGKKKFLAKKWNQTEQFWNFFICVLWDMCLMSWWFLCCRNLGYAIRSYSSGSPVRAFFTSLEFLNFQILNLKWFWWLVLEKSDNVMCHLSFWIKSLFIGWEALPPFLLPNLLGTLEREKCAKVTTGWFGLYSLLFDVKSATQTMAFIELKTLEKSGAGLQEVFTFNCLLWDLFIF